MSGSATARRFNAIGKAIAPAIFLTTWVCSRHRGRGHRWAWFLGVRAYGGGRPLRIWLLWVWRGSCARMGFWLAPPNGHDAPPRLGRARAWAGSGEHVWKVAAAARGGPWDSPRRAWARSPAWPTTRHGRPEPVWSAPTVTSAGQGAARWAAGFATTGPGPRIPRDANRRRSQGPTEKSALPSQTIGVRWRYGLTSDHPWPDR